MLRDFCGIMKYNVLMPIVLMVSIQEKIINPKIKTLLLQKQIFVSVQGLLVAWNVIWDNCRGLGAKNKNLRHNL
jgi:hypothetical protein